MKSFLLFTISFLLIFTNLSAQIDKSDFGVFGGCSYYIGDLNTNKHFLKISPSIGAFYRYNLHKRWSIKGGVIKGKVYGDDALSKNNYQKIRNLSFSSEILEFTIQFEFNFFPFQSGETKNYPSPYIFAGGSFFSFNPVGTLDGEKYNLQKLGTEGQGLTTNPNKKYYSLMRPSFPFGFGIKFNPINRISVALEWGLRRCFTDYLDDVSTEYPNKYELAAEKGEEASRLSDKSINGIGDKTGLQRGNPNTKDYYSFAGIIIYYKLFKPRCPQFQ